MIPHTDGNTEKHQAKDTGMALVLILLILFYLTENRVYVGCAVAALVADMVWPRLYHWPAKAWFGLAAVLSTIMSKVVLTVVFFAVVTPIGALRTLTGADPMLIRKWKAGGESVFKERNHTFAAGDLKRPY